jgi:hypothetical protein
MSIPLHPDSLENAYRSVTFDNNYFNNIFPAENALHNPIAFLSYELDINHIPTKTIVRPHTYSPLSDTTIMNNIFERIKWKKGLGLTSYIANKFESGAKGDLIGYIKNGIEVGTIYPDWFFTDIPNPNESHLIQIIPNPAFDKIQLSTIQASIRFSIIDIMGREIFPLTEMDTPQEIPLSHWAQGIYFVQLQDDKGNVYTEKFLKE